jgi:phospholipid-transporting ATPase
LYRGAKLKNTKWIYGMVIYTGKNTKIMMNLNKTHSKISQIEKKVNEVLIYIFAGQIILCLLAAVLSGT